MKSLWDEHGSESYQRVTGTNMRSRRASDSVSKGAFLNTVPKKSELPKLSPTEYKRWKKERRDHWNFLLCSLEHSIDQIYYFCEMDDYIIGSYNASTILKRGIEDFQNLDAKIKQQQIFTSQLHKGEVPSSLPFWDIRKPLSRLKEFPLEQPNINQVELDIDEEKRKKIIAEIEKSDEGRNSWADEMLEEEEEMHRKLERLKEAVKKKDHEKILKKAEENRLKMIMKQEQRVKEQNLRRERIKKLSEEKQSRKVKELENKNRIQQSKAESLRLEKMSHMKIKASDELKKVKEVKSISKNKESSLIKKIEEKDKKLIIRKINILGK